MKVYQALTNEQLAKHREILIWMLGELDLELAKRIASATNQDELREALKGISRQKLAEAGIV